MKRTALYQEHLRLGGRMVDFGGWELPVQYTGVIEEHKACRSSVGLFDVSHMGEFHVEGNGASAFLDRLLTNLVSGARIGQAQYNLMCNEAGGVVDDLVVYRRAEERFLLVVNAANQEKDFSWVQAKASELAYSGKLEDRSADYAQIAVQGRNAARILAPLCPGTDLQAIKTYWFSEGRILGEAAIIARTGYTGEDGFEVYVPWAHGPAVWRGLLEGCQSAGGRPCGLGARDTLRLEMKYPLYGHELTESTDPLDAGLGWVVKLAKPSFVGKEAIAAKRASAAGRPKLLGFRIAGRGIARPGYKILRGGESAGTVTSGSFSPSLGLGIGIAWVEPPECKIGERIAVDVRGAPLDAEIAATPFYKRDY